MEGQNGLLRSDSQEVIFEIAHQELFSRWMEGRKSQSKLTKTQRQLAVYRQGGSLGGRKGGDEVAFLKDVQRITP